MNEESALRQKARDAIRAGRLPARHPVRTWAGKGGGGACRVCERPVTVDEIELELEFAPGEAACPGLGDCRVHANCFEAWKAELVNR